ncbi:CRISPR-associated protein, Cas1 family [Glycomyces sambucus]|uniref:CRISPR-associated endonuclease Cas1 n=1 Tax=Glycomyces sambucus TaxID=380244 RepID=A0A1G9CLN1_9ACTN|nr:type I-E CRISPR-associated endonuclease Cas1e [Glycomyces sambucus]SDK52610.1 CRISPR-associated protein, Cas1 family [Glycomyces sambucus]
MSPPRDFRARLAAPSLAMLPRIGDSLSFLYLDIVRIIQDDTGISAKIETRRGIDTVELPTAALSCLLLGPGASITTRALATLARHGTTVICTGAGGVRSYAAITPEGLTTTWLEHQATAWAQPDRRLEVAVRMYEHRFGETVPSGTTLERLRGLEGQRMKAMYRLLAQRHRIKPFKLSYNPEDWDQQDAVNQALSSANNCLYGIVHAAILALGCSPALGFVHQGKQHAFVYDIADLYKAELTLPLAFSLHDSHNPESDARRKLREQLRLFRLLPRIVGDIQGVLAPDDAKPRSSDERKPVRLVHLWDPETGAVPAGTNYSNTEND